MLPGFCVMQWGNVLMAGSEVIFFWVHSLPGWAKPEYLNTWEAGLHVGCVTTNQTMVYQLAYEKNFPFCTEYYIITDFIANILHTKQQFISVFCWNIFICYPVKHKWCMLAQILFSECKHIYICSACCIASHLCFSPLAASPWILITVSTPTTPCGCFIILHHSIGDWPPAPFFSNYIPSSWQ